MRTATEQESQTVEVPLSVPSVIRKKSDVLSLIADIRWKRHLAQEILENEEVRNAKSVLDDANKRVNEIKESEAALFELVKKSLLGFLQRFAIANRIKGKTIPFGNDSISMRSLPGSIEVTDREAALDWCRKFAPQAVVNVPMVQVSLLPDDVRKLMMDEPKAALQRGFKVIQPSEKVDIKLNG